MSDAFDLLGAQRAVFRSSLSAAEKLVLLAMLDHWSRRETEPFPSVPKLEDWTSLGRTTVIEAIKALERGDVLKVKREVGKPNRYDLSGVCPGSLPVRQSDQSATRTRPSGEPHPSATRTEPVRQADPKEPRKEPKKEPRGSARTRRPSWRKVPEDWQPKPEHRALAAELGVNFEDELRKFRRYNFSRARRDADATFENWLNRADSPRRPLASRVPVQRGVTDEAEAQQWGRGAQAQALLGGCE